MTLEEAALQWAEALDDRFDHGRPFPYDPEEHERIVIRLHEAQRRLYMMAKGYTE